MEILWKYCRCSLVHLTYTSTYETPRIDFTVCTQCNNHLCLESCELSHTIAKPTRSVSK